MSDGATIEQMPDRSDDSPVTWGELREAVSLIIDLSMQYSALVASDAARAALGHTPQTDSLPDPIAKLARTIEDRYKLDQLRDD